MRGGQGYGEAAGRARPPRRLAATVTDLLDGADDLHAFGAADAALACADATDAELTRLARRTAVASGLGTGLISLASGLTLWASCSSASPPPGPARCPGCR